MGWRGSLWLTDPRYPRPTSSMTDGPRSPRVRLLAASASIIVAIAIGIITGLAFVLFEWWLLGAAFVTAAIILALGAGVAWRAYLGMSLAERLAYLEREGQWQQLGLLISCACGFDRDDPRNLPGRTGPVVMGAADALATLRRTIATMPRASLAGAIVSRADDTADSISRGLWPQVELITSVSPVGEAGDEALQERLRRMVLVSQLLLDTAGALSALALSHGVAITDDLDERLRRLSDSARSLSAPP